MELIFIDAETTGLDPAADEILSVSWRVTDMHGRDPRRVISSRDRDTLLFMPDKEPDPDVAEINGYDAKTWKANGGETFDRVHAEQIADAVANRYWVGSHPRFDFDFITAAMGRVCSRKLRPLTHPLIDIGSIAWPRIVSGELPGPNQSQLSAALIDRMQSHTSEQDVADMVAIYQRLIDFGRFAALPTAKDLADAQESLQATAAR